jgi:ribosomal protein S18 acetylase RimI-like enzyme
VAEDVPCIGPLADPERAAAARVIARAFLDNPLNLAVVSRGDARRRERCNAAGARLVLPVARRHGDVLGARLSDDLCGVLLAARPGGHPLPAPPLAERLRCLWAQGWRVAARWARVFEALEAVHPPEPHWYLGTLGVVPERQGRGVGGALLDRWVERVESDGVPLYLETDRSRNVSFYERRGFVVLHEIRVLDVPVWCMQRPVSRS